MNGKKPTFGSVCDGIGCGHLAFEREGYDCLWSAEIDAFPSAVLKERFPHVRNVGNMKKIRGKLKEAFIKAPDVFIGGTPCQSWSIAGKRKGLDDERGNLSLEFCRIADGIDAVRHSAGKDGCVVLWENVPGVLSDKGNGFGCILGMLAGEDEAIDVKKWPRAGVVCGTRRRVAWRILDSQYFGVAQRRRRVFVIAVPNETIERLGARADPAEILSIGTSLRRDTPTRGKAGEGATGYAPSSFGKYSKSLGTLRASGGDLGGGPECLVMAHGQENTETLKQWPADVTCTLNAAFGDKMGLEDQHALNGASLFVPAQAIYENHANDSRVTGPHDVSPMPTARMGTGGGNVPLVGPGVIAINTKQQSQNIGDDVANSLGANDYKEPQAVCFPSAISFERRMVRTTGGQPQEELCGCLRADENTGDGAPCVAISDVLHGDKACNGKGWNDDGSAHTLDTMTTQGVCVGAFKGGQGAKAGSIGFSEHLSPTLSSADSGSNRVPVVAQGVCTPNASDRFEVKCEKCGERYDTKVGIPNVCEWCDHENKPIAECFRTTGNCGAWSTGDKTNSLTTSTDPNSHVIATSTVFSRPNANAFKDSPATGL